MSNYNNKNKTVAPVVPKKHPLDKAVESIPTLQDLYDGPPTTQIKPLQNLEKDLENADLNRVQLDRNTGLYVNKIKNVAFKHAADARRWNDVIDRNLENNKPIRASATDSWNSLKATASPAEKKELLKAEQRYNNKVKSNDKPFVAKDMNLNLSFPKIQSESTPEEIELKRLEGSYKKILAEKHYQKFINANRGLRHFAPGGVDEE